jgi:two-component system, cell cycle sensor histidine kinase and response regulator CckA
VSSPLWIWPVAAVALAAIGVAVYAMLALGRREETIRRQLAREASLKARFDEVFERTSDIVVVHDRRGRLSTINRAGEHALGYAREEARMLEPSWIFGNDYTDAITRMIEGGAGSQPQSFRSELSRRRGGRVPVEVHARVLIGDGHVVGVMAIARDLSERDRLENELRQAQKMEAVGRLATGIAHDFNNLITILIGYGDELLEHIPESSEARHPAVSVRRAADRASALTQQLLAFSRRQTAVSNTIDLNRLIADMDDMLRRLLGPQIRIDLSLQPDLAAITGDASQIGQVLMNLAVNARDAMPGGGTLSVATSNVDLGEEHLDIIPGPHVLLTVADNGEGMAGDVRNRLFEPFFTTKEAGRGTGLGLSMVHSIVRQCGGHIQVDTASGAGTRFHVYFPSRPAAAVETSTITAPARTTIKGEGLVLLAEDDASVRRLVVAELTRRGFTVIEAEDGRAALDAFERDKDRIDILVTDVVMPRMNGADLARAAERIRPGVRILFISGHPERAGQGLDPTGITNLLMKPFTADTLAARIKDMMAPGKEAHGSSA